VTGSIVQRLPYVLPLVVFLVFAGYFWTGLGKDPHRLPSTLIGQPLPHFDLSSMPGDEAGGLVSTDLRGEVALLNIFGSWCAACQLEHPFLMQLKERNSIPIYGIDWRERDPAAGPIWLKRHGNPYTRIGADPDSKAAIALGVTGAPETFLIDASGVVRYKLVGALTPETWEREIWPLVQRLRERS
jgi:cytochrome c biogenesis protein CcmG/thiol:disulfide interchange protein DsbE